jgi:hypothetical protein
MESVDIFADIFGIVCCCAITIGAPALGGAAFLWDRRRRQQTSDGRAKIGTNLGLVSLPPKGGQDRFGGPLMGCEWLVGWEVRKVAGGPPKFVTFFECSRADFPRAEVRYQSAPSLGLEPSVVADHPAFDAVFQAAGELSLDTALVDDIMTVVALGDDLAITPEKIILLCADDHKEEAYLKERIDAVAQLAQRLAT